MPQRVFCLTTVALEKRYLSALKWYLLHLQLHIHDRIQGRMILFRNFQDRL